MLFCTLARPDRMAHAIVWSHSVKQFHPDSELVLGVLGHDGSVYPPGLFHRIIPLDNHGIPLNSTESTIAAKANLIKLLLTTSAYGRKIVYMEPDTKLYSPLLEVEAILDTSFGIAVPFLLSPSEDASRELARLRHGLFQASFLALRASGETRRFAVWWSASIDSRFFGQTKDVYADHRWLDAAVWPCDFYVWKDPAYHMSAFNIHEHARAIVKNEEGYRLLGGSMLRSFYFYNQDGVLEKEINQMDPARAEAFRMLLAEYNAEVFSLMPPAEPQPVATKRKRRNRKSRLRKSRRRRIQRSGRRQNTNRKRKLILPRRRRPLRKSRKRSGMRNVKTA